MAKTTRRIISIQKSYQFQTYKAESEIVFTEEESISESIILARTREEECKVRKEVLQMIRVDFPNYAKTSKNMPSLD